MSSRQKLWVRLFVGGAFAARKRRPAATEKTRTRHRRFARSYVIGTLAIRILAGQQESSAEGLRNLGEDSVLSPSGAPMVNALASARAWRTRSGLRNNNWRERQGSFWLVWPPL